MALNCTLVDIDSIFHTSVQGTYFITRWFLAQNLNILRTKTPIGFTIHSHQFYWDQGIMWVPWLKIHNLNCANNSLGEMTSHQRQGLVSFTVKLPPISNNYPLALITFKIWISNCTSIPKYTNSLVNVDQLWPSCTQHSWQKNWASF